MKILKMNLACAFLMAAAACAHESVNSVSDAEASRIDRTLVKDTVVYEPGAKEGAVVPDISAPRLRAIEVAERIENGRLIEKHREWIVRRFGDVGRV